MSRRHTKAARRRSFREHCARVEFDAWLDTPASRRGGPAKFALNFTFDIEQFQRTAAQLRASLAAASAAARRFADETAAFTRRGAT